MLYELILINEIEQRAKIIFLSACFLPYGELTVRYLQNLSQFGSMLVNISFPFIQSKEKIG